MKPLYRTLFACSIVALLGTGCVSCYRMPTDDDFSVVPTTNNPSVTCEKNTGPIPNMPY